ncbi:MAG: hypothetical protein EPO00_12200 [Chloroflexota bacterium]|nr:MAG: hypothetical protein EPO00_12200 [Chloroflexota bacterium]
MRTNALPGFKPSINGFRFANRWPPGPAFELRVPYLRVGIGEVSEGLCGGMCFAVADRYLMNEPAPADPFAPAAGTPLFREIVRRQLVSFDRWGQVPARFWLTLLRLAIGRWTGSAQIAEWRRIRADIDAGRPAMVGLVRSGRVNPFGLTTNHQVLAYAYEASATSGTLRIYDPNHPGADDVELRIRRARVEADPAGRAAGPAKNSAFILEQSTGEPLLALLRLPYRGPR